MPTFRLMSDLHLEFRGNSKWSAHLAMKETPADVLILAGDIGIADRGEMYAFLDVACSHYPDVIMVMGNHEHYGGDFLKTEETIRNCTETLPNFHLLERSYIDLDGVRYIGASLWTDFHNDDPLIKLHLSKFMSDYRVIRFGDRQVLPDDVYENHVASLTYIKGILSLPFDGSKVVITHHAPHENSVASKYKHETDTNYGYYTDLTDVLGQSKYWLHGHMHEYCEYEVNGTTVIANPWGYPREATGFRTTVRNI